MKTPLILSLIGCALFLSSCATPNFQREWQQAVAETKAPYKDITGPWQGEWVSGHNQHTGELKCVVTETGPNQYRFHYFARWAGAMKGTFNIICHGERRGRTVAVSGEKKLPPFGTYNHRGTLTPTTFDAKFGSDSKDFGTFKLSRPASQ